MPHPAIRAADKSPVPGASRAGKKRSLSPKTGGHDGAFSMISEREAGKEIGLTSRRMARAVIA
jgi:hypothetical protein